MIVDRVCVPDAAAMLALGAARAKHLRPGQLIFLEGELGSGKTTLVRGLLHGHGYRGLVKSPTYTLVEPYELRALVVYHLDLYRLEHPEELEGLGIRDYLSAGGVCLVEWPERGNTLLPDPDVRIRIHYNNSQRIVEFHCLSELGQTLCAAR